jgi:hypothetical protein
LIQVTGGNEFDTVYFYSPCGITGTLNTVTDGGQPDLVIGSIFLFFSSAVRDFNLPGLAGRGCQNSGNRYGCGSEGKLRQEFPP